MSTFPTPVVLPLPVDVDLTKLDYTPIYDEYLVKSRSWLRAKNWRGEGMVPGPGLGFVLFNLWTAAFRAVPAGSLEDDDDVLADAAHCDIAYWKAIRPTATIGWEAIEGRLHHPVVSAIAWAVWISRLDSRHENARRSWSALAARKHNQGLDVPEPPPTDFAAWVATQYPHTASYMTAHHCYKPSCTTDLASDIRPKQSKGKVISPPDSPPQAKPGLGTGGARAGKDWFAAEERRICAEFDELTKPLQSLLQEVGKSSRYTLVHALSGAWLDREGPAIVVPTPQRAAALRQKVGDDIAKLWPGLQIRHGLIDELRARKASQA